MADNPDALRVAVDGGKCYIADVGSTVPSGLEAFGGEWRDLGLISDEGVNEAYEEERSERRPWGYKSAVRTDVTAATKTFSMTAWETNVWTRALYDNVLFEDIEELADGVIHFPVKRPTGKREFMLAIDSFDGTNHIRTIVPKAEITERGEQVNSAEEVIGYNFTWTAYELSDQTMFDRYVLASGVWLPVDTLEISGGATVVVEATEQLTADAHYFDDTDTDVSSDADWESDDEEVATVDSAGEVTGVSAGDAVITATYRGLSATHDIEVTAA
ncbi:hypothetical protein F4561_002664 [Lipingzhangella halophila]|uniref:BIG2 domain-containing protein n=1 Tax=Lipingzhangella halophila TaxID=1783352 RepID=A0A7W7W3I5_9ACTN|nr:Ig-like domain-containing protein [Lipingzhangella halophila]MBB4931844.1 hypothetical protein [Lipingzhangella halophila]